ncbi:MAG: Crp/Fnr family transcriptional regulator [Oscillospiraceae bacterium]|nr:Crp/Fnr family transcriptional regulator [Oscillospiraceae bacterium]
MYEEIKRVLSGLRARRFDEGEVIFRIGDMADSFFFLKSGLAMTVAATNDRQERTVMTTWPGRTFGAASFCCRCFRRSTAIAAKPSEVVSVNWGTYRSLIDTYPDMAHFLASELAEDVNSLFDQMLEDSVLDADAKVARYIVHRIDRRQCTVKDGVFSIEQTQDFIGRILGISRWSVNQALTRFRAAGWLSTSYGAITVLDLNGLRQFAPEE